jgi:hypothetical protein
MKNIPMYLLFIILLLPLYNYAQTIQSNISDLSAGADLIVKGKVTSQQSVWNDRKTAIYTKVTIEIEEYIKGVSAAATVIVTHPGGEIGDVGEMYTHVPVFVKGENILLFAKKSNNNDYVVYEGEVGKITLYTNDKGEAVTSQRQKYTALREEIKKSISEKH